jgi:hypothetical protein
MHFQNNLSFISASFCKMCCNQMIVHMLDYNFLVRVPCQLLPGTKYQQSCVFSSIYVVKMTLFDNKYIKKGVKRGSQSKKNMHLQALLSSKNVSTHSILINPFSIFISKNFIFLPFFSCKNV